MPSGYLIALILLAIVDRAVFLVALRLARREDLPAIVRACGSGERA
jgi:hypothetical protein